MKALGFLGLLLLAAGCVQGRWDTADLEARHGSLAGIPGQRLGDTRPYVLARDGELVLFLCRWERDDPIPVSLAPGATEEERRLVGAALGAWEGAGLGLRFEVHSAEAEGIRIRFADRQGDRLGSAALTVADCRVEPGAGPVIPARLARASVRLYRAELDFRGEPVVYTEEQLAGSLLHELGHALGFQGHVRRGGSVMVRTTDNVARLGRGLLAGRALEAPSARALYALPSGSIVRRVSVGRARTAPADRFFELSATRSLRGPFARVGDRDARIAWRLDDGRWLPLMIYGVDEAVANPKTFELVPVGAAKRLLEGS